MRAYESTPHGRDLGAQERPGRSQLDAEMADGYKTLAEENHALAEQAIVVDNESWPIEPEFIEQAGAIGVRFLPSGYIAPHRIEHSLTDRHRAILHLLSQVDALALREIRARMQAPPSDRTLQNDLDHLKRLNLIEAGGFGRGARYWLKRGNPE